MGYFLPASNPLCYIKIVLEVKSLMATADCMTTCEAWGCYPLKTRRPGMISISLLDVSAVRVIHKTMVVFGGFHSGLIFSGNYSSLFTAGLQIHGSTMLLRNPPCFLASTLSHFPQKLFQTLSTVFALLPSQRVAVSSDGQ